MAKLGDIFNYKKPGPGIDKNAPKKKGVALFFSIFFEKFWKLIPLSLLYVVTALPLLTSGLSGAAIAYITRNFSREKPVMLASDFFDTIKKNWKQALPVGIINLLLTAILLFAMWFYYLAWNAGFFYKAGLVIAGCIFIVFTFLKYYIYFLLVTFDLNIKQLYKNSLLLSSAGIKENIIITLSLAGVYAFFFGVPLFCVLKLNSSDLIPLLFMVLIVLFLPAIQAFIIQFCVFPVIKKHMIDPYYEAHPEAKKEQTLLNLFYDEGEEEAVFKDMGATATVEEETSIPKQYSERDIKQIRKRNKNDDDDTI